MMFRSEEAVDAREMLESPGREQIRPAVRASKRGGIGAVMTRSEAAEYLRVSVRSFDTHVRRSIPEHRIGRKAPVQKGGLGRMARPAEGWRLRKHRNRYYVRFTHAGERVELSTGAGDPEEAARRAARLYAEYHAGGRPSRLKATDPSAPLVEVGALWLAEVERELDAGTLDTMLVYVRHFDAFFGTMGGVTDSVCARYARDRLTRVKRQTVQKELSALRRFLAWCVEQGILSRVPVVPALPRRSIGTPYEKRRRSKPTALTRDEARALIDALPECSSSKKVVRFGVRARFRFAWETALRPSTVDQLSVPENYVRGSRVLVITDEIDKIRFGRELPLTDGAREALDSVCPDSGAIFGRHDYRDQLRKAATKTLPPERARTFAAYDLRHARATEWAESGNLVGVAYLLGHKQVTTTNRYARPNEAAAKRVLGVKDVHAWPWKATGLAYSFGCDRGLRLAA